MRAGVQVATNATYPFLQWSPGSPGLRVSQLVLRLEQVLLQRLVCLALRP